ncbi:hypothetical protein KPH14_012194 [Odynerus spinipes]|uniref:Retrovirus-related Pol polyprotein from transposon TNT 1-94 n=1 Tax=Odynerus spinipes TaxID=1348599 RepID=A0AAD9VLG6_9HYME|nr:hypothetical protein KPH14_012194 [Odynerus spinipes]
MEEHINRMTDVHNQLLAIGEDIKENLFIAMMLCSLPESYNSLINAFESRPEKDLTLSLVKGKLLDEYRRRTNCFASAHEEGNTALKVQGGIRQTTGTGTNYRTSQCFFCKRKGHVKKECRKYKAWKEKAEKANQVVENNNFCFSLQPNINDKKAWYIDSGATSQMTSDKEFFDNLCMNVKDNVTLADGKVIEIQGTGSGTIKCITKDNKERVITVTNVLYVPDLYGNLLSVKRISDNGFKMEFIGNECNIIKDNEIIATADSIGNLYKLRVNHKALITIDKHNKKCIHTWHRKLGHRDPEAIMQLCKMELAYNINIEPCNIKETCKTCIKGKMARKTFPKKSERRTKEILELIHSDVCGPMHTTTPGGKRHLLTFIDDYSGYTEVYLLSHKSEVYQKFKEYLAFVKNKYNKKPKVIRSDRGKEYVNHNLISYLKDEGIKMELTAPYSPQQNGKAERKNRYLIEMARCMIIDSEKPSFKDIHVFGCEAYVHIPDERRRKLDVKAKKLHFVGYSNESKAFRLLDKDTNKIVVSRDVIFLDNASKQEESEGLDKERFAQSDAEIELGNMQLIENNEEKLDHEEEIRKIQKTRIDQEKGHMTPRRSERINKGVPPLRLDQYAGIAIKETDWNEAKRIVRYLKATIGYKLRLGYNSKEEQLIGYADANWAESRNDRKSNSGYVFKYWGSTISWTCRKQTCVALSSAEAEYIALSEACQEGLWIIKLLEDFCEVTNLPIKLYEDNQSCIKLSSNQKFSKRSKHIDTKYHFIKELQEGNVIKLTYCHTNDMLADMLTKPLQSTKLKQLSQECGLSTINDVDVEEEC